jgi:peptide/nickel transport system permease protein
MTKSSSLRSYLLVRLVLTVPLVVILLTVVFILMRVAPGDPVTAASGGALSPQEIAQARHAYGLDRPLLTQYLSYLGNSLSGNFGRSIVDNRAITSIIVDNGAATLELSVAAMIVAIVCGVGIGVVAARFRGTPLDLGGRLFAVVAYATPVFFLGLLGQLVFGRWLGWLPTSGEASPLTTYVLPTHTHIMVIDAIIAGDWSALGDVLRHLILPAVTLGLVLSGLLIRFVRVNLIRTLGGDYVEAARARGLRERRVVVNYAVRNALVPIVTVLGLQVALLMSGAVLTEQTFSWPGIGNQLIHYLNDRDYVAVEGIVTFFAIVVAIVSVVIDLAVAWIDPRVRY